MALLRKLAFGSQPEPVEIEPLTPDVAARLRPSLFARFTAPDLARYVAAHPGLAWVVRDQNSYAVGGHWRRRQEIGEVVEVSRGPYRRPLLRRLLQSFADTGAVLVVLDFEESGADGAFYADEGFRPIERIVEYERRGCQADQPVPDVDIRSFRTRDLEAVLAIERESFPWLWWNSAAELDYYQQMPDVEICVSLEGSLPVGYAGVTVRGTAAHLDRLAVRRAYQRRGHGSALLAFVLTRLESLDVRRVTLSTQEDNRRSQALYERFGFRRGRWTYDIRGLWLREPPEATP